jgi:hypothetical protein
MRPQQDFRTNSRRFDPMDPAERPYLAAWLLGWYARRVFQFVVSARFVVGVLTGIALAYAFG